VRCAIAIPQQVADGTFDPAALRAYLTRAEQLGFAGAWTQEQVIGTLPLLGPVETLSYAAACTERLRLGCAVLVTSLHSPVHLAKSLSTLDQLSRGRLDVGIGTGGRRMFSAFGVDPESFVARFSEGLRLMRTLWTEPRVDFDGRFWQLAGAAMEPKPFPEAGPAGLVRREPSGRAPARGQTRRRVLRHCGPDPGIGVGAARRLRAGAARGGGRGRRDDPAQPALRRGRADGALGRRGSAAADLRALWTRARR
jgi:alkanesulfonate monooxygenase SsuD/methylene tetrahydromethanopterin reductase-like flavin-dependent oxidoreductase (luciferase family)